MYQELLDKCKQAYKDKNMALACKYWEQIYEVLDKKLDSAKDEKERYNAYLEHHKIMEQFTNDEVYDITDYGKARAYEDLARENVMNGYTEVDLNKLGGGEDLSEIEEFCSMYDWIPVKSNNGFNIVDTQLNTLVEDEDYKTFTELVNRIVGRAIDYFRDEQEWDEMDDEMLNYALGLYRIAENHKDGTKWEENWLYDFKKELEDFS